MPKYNKNQTSAALTLRNNLESQLDSYIEDQHCANETATAVISLLVDGSDNLNETQVKHMHKLLYMLNTVQSLQSHLTLQ
ncbi:hypothetical protein [Mucilaginibacter sp.]|uniref:hypothetical protein n=1 Tax=Mucilaginibacter sp. TaxID=1882438 RepID=UPI00262340B2|nr:hypothetical protein [Mucilaginibacter sp.]MDB4919861.1 hypothetical protein [Mucilaginibacter sp.]